MIAKKNKASLTVKQPEIVVPSESESETEAPASVLLKQETQELEAGGTFF